MTAPSSAATLRPPEQAVERFTLWALGTLGCAVAELDRAAYRVQPPESLREGVGEAVDVVFSASAAGEHFQLAAPGTPFFAWMVDRLHDRGAFLHAAPADQPGGVHELSGRLFAPYEFESGHMHLAGCSIEERPLIRMTCLAANHQPPADEHDSQAEPADPVPPSEELVHLFLDPQHGLWDDETVARFGLDHLTPYTERTPQYDAEQVHRVVEAARTAAGERFGEGGWKQVAAALVWCKYAVGRLAMTSGDQTVYVEFEGWTQDLVDGVTKPPPYHCPLCDASSYRLATADDGRIAPAEAVVACQQTGSRVLLAETATCKATGKLVTAELLAACPVSGLRVLEEELTACGMCGQQVSPTCITGGRCSACNDLTAVRVDDARVARLLGEYPRLEGWKHWKIHEAAEVYVFVARSWLRRLLLVVDPESFEVRRAAVCGRLVGHWQELTGMQRAEILQ